MFKGIGAVFLKWSKIGENCVLDLEAITSVLQCIRN